MARIAKDDPVFIDGFCIELSDERCWEELSSPLKTLVLAEAAAGNKAFNIGAHASPRRIYVQLSGPAKTDVTKLPEGLTLRKGFSGEFAVYDTDLYGVWDIANMHSVTFAKPKAPGIPGIE